MFAITFDIITTFRKHEVLKTTCLYGYSRSSQRGKYPIIESSQQLRLPNSLKNAQPELILRPQLATITGTTTQPIPMSPAATRLCAIHPFLLHPNLAIFHCKLQMLHVSVISRIVDEQASRLQHRNRQRLLQSR